VASPLMCTKPAPEEEETYGILATDLQTHSSTISAARRMTSKETWESTKLDSYMHSKLGTPSRMKRDGFEVLQVSLRKLMQTGITGTLLFEGVDSKRLASVNNKAGAAVKCAFRCYYHHSAMLVVKPPRDILELYNCKSDPMSDVYVLEATGPNDTPRLSPLTDSLAQLATVYDIQNSADEEEWAIGTRPLYDRRTRKAMKKPEEHLHLQEFWAWLRTVHQKSYPVSVEAVEEYLGAIITGRCTPASPEANELEKLFVNALNTEALEKLGILSRSVVTRGEEKYPYTYPISSQLPAKIGLELGFENAQLLDQSLESPFLIGPLHQVTGCSLRGIAEAKLRTGCGYNQHEDTSLLPDAFQCSIQ